jgi:DNA-binding transcriptional regulator YiaG
MMVVIEVWKDVKGYEGAYQVSNHGNVRSLDRYVNSHKDGIGKRLTKGKNIKQQKDRKGYIYVHLSLQGKGKNKKMHRLVAEAFCRKNKDANMVNHKDGNKENNRADNLEWTLIEDNIKHAIASGLRNISGQNARDNILTEEDVMNIRDNHEESYTELASKYGVSKSTIADIKKFRSWKWLGGDELIDTSEINQKKFSKAIKEIRMNSSLTIVNFAESLGVSRHQVMRWEKGTAFPKDGLLRKILETYNLELDELV